MSISWNKQTNVQSTLDKLYSSLSNRPSNPKQKITKPRRKKPSFYAYLKYDHSGAFIESLVNDTHLLALHHPTYAKNSLNSVSVPKGKYSGCSCYGYFWRRQINKNDPIPAYLNDDMLKNYLKKKGSILRNKDTLSEK